MFKNSVILHWTTLFYIICKQYNILNTIHLYYIICTPNINETANKSTIKKIKNKLYFFHRPLGSSASVASRAGTDYKSKKAKGDIKKKGKPDPYAYLPLSRKNLNKR